MSRDKVHLRIPVIKGGKPDWEYVEVDPERIDLSIVSQLWQRKRPGQDAYATGPFIPFAGIITPELSASELLQTLEDIKMQWRTALLTHGEVGEAAWKHISELGFDSLITALATGQVEEANHALMGILYGLLSLTSELAESSANADGAHDLVSRMAHTLEAEAQITNELLLQWAIAAEDVVATVEALELIETEVTDLQTRVALHLEKVEKQLVDLPKDRGFLEGDKDNDGFLMIAFAHQSAPDKHEKTLRTALPRAREIVEQYKKLSELVTQEWATAFGVKPTELLAQQRGLDRYADALRTASRQMDDLEQRFGSQQVRPFDSSDERPLIEEERFERAQSLRADQKWGPRTCQLRISTLIGGTIDLINSRPGLPREFQSLLAEVETTITRLDGDPPSFPEPGDDGLQTGKPTNKRSFEIYEMVIAVASVLTCKPLYLAGSEPKAMVEILQRLGKISDEEVGIGIAAVDQFSNEGGQTETVHKSGQVIERWKKTGAAWISYQVNQGSRWRLKLALQRKEQAERLMTKHSLTEDDIKSTHKARREEKLHASLERQGGSPEGKG